LSTIELTKFFCFKKARYSDLVSVLGMVACEDESARDALTFCLTGTRRNLVAWGHEYLRCLAGQIGAEYESKQEKEEDCDQIIELVAQIIPEFINHNEEPEAVDLLLEVERLNKLIDHCTDKNFERVCRYLLSCAPYAPDTNEMLEHYNTACNIYRKYKKFPEALRVAQKMNDMDIIGDLMEECTDKITLK